MGRRSCSHEISHPRRSIYSTDLVAKAAHAGPNRLLFNDQRPCLAVPYPRRRVGTLQVSVVGFLISFARLTGTRRRHIRLLLLPGVEVVGLMLRRLIGK